MTEPAITVYAEDFDGNEDYYFELCKSSDLEKDQIKTCKEFKNHLSTKKQELENKIKENNSKINSLELQLKDIYDLLYEVNEAIAVQNDKIEVLDTQITLLEESIEKNDNTIHFLRWTWLMDFGSGYAYSINGIDKPRLPYLTKTIPLVEDGWYYYEEDYNQKVADD